MSSQSNTTTINTTVAPSQEIKEQAENVKQNVENTAVEVKEDVKDTSNGLLAQAAVKAGEIKEAIGQTVGQIGENLAQAVGSVAVKASQIQENLTRKVDDVAQQTSQKKEEVKLNYEIGKANAEVRNTPISTMDQQGMTLQERAQLAADEVFRAAGEAPVEEENSFGGTLGNAIANTVEYAKLAALKTVNTASNVAQGVSQAVAGVPRQVDLSELEQKKAQEKVNELKAEHDEFQEKAEKKKDKMHAKIQKHAAEGEHLSLPTDANPSPTDVAGAKEEASNSVGIPMTHQVKKDSSNVVVGAKEEAANSVGLPLSHLKKDSSVKVE